MATDPSSDHERRAFFRRFVALLPTVVLTVLAINQIRLTQSDALTPWKGGGFGMFASNDSRGNRFVRMFVSAPDRNEELALPPSLEDLAIRAAALPSERRLALFAEGIAAREARYERPVSVVRVQVWRTTFAPDALRPEDLLVRELEWHVD